MKSLSLIWIGTMRRRKLTFYMLNGVYLVRAKSSLSGEKVKHAACFKNTMKSASRLARASVIASTVYKQLPEGWKLHSLYRAMVGIGARMLKAEDCAVAAIEMAMQQYLFSVGYREVKTENTDRRKKGTEYRKQHTRCRKQIVGTRYTIKGADRLLEYPTALHSPGNRENKHWFQAAPT